MGDRLSRFRREAAGATAIEFAIVAPIFLILIIEILQAGVTMYVFAAIESATVKSARLIATGSLPQTASTADGFRTQTFCPNLLTGLSCNAVVTNLQTTTLQARTYGGGYMNFVKSDYSGLVAVPMNNAQSTYCPGGPGTFIYLQAFYAMPVFSPTALASAVLYNGRRVRFLRAAAALRNEPFTNSYAGFPSC